MKDFLSGKKAHLMGAAAVVYGIFGIITGNLTPDEGMKVIWAGLTTSAVRAGISKAGS